MSVAAVEVEISLQFYEQQAKDGKHTFLSVCSREKPYVFDSVIATCKELSIPILAYSYALSFLFSASHSS
jgi:NAD-specific glutamate dehydrogenase